MAHTYFLHQIRHKKDGWEKGIVIKEAQSTPKENLADALQGFHAFLGAYAYGHDANTDYVSCGITDRQGNRLKWEVWDSTDAPEGDGENE